MAGEKLAGGWSTAAVVGLAVSAGGGCAKILDVDWGSYTDAGGAGGTGGGIGSGGAARTGGGAGESAADGDGRPAIVCVPGRDRQCSGNTPQRCNEAGQWEDEAPCRAETPACSGGACTFWSCAGLPATCGPDGNEDCCASAAVPGGSFTRWDQGIEYSATVSGFLLDRFEVTVGRFRRFVEAYPGSMPAPRAGAHPKIDGSGWDAGWNGKLPADAAALKAAVNCNANRQAWTDEAGGHERLPMNCLSWYVAFAFCSWDGGRLPTEAEWHYAAAGGDEQRPYPWSDLASDETIDTSYAVYDCAGDGSASDSCAFSDLQPVGSRSPKGDGRWEQADLAGNVWEWVLDWHAVYQEECDDCAALAAASYRVMRGGSYYRDASSLLSYSRGTLDPSSCYGDGGARCARTP
ncbi:SUMF1/EgtB/PvdO family nonheme iron enzyme [Sorangium sp. So ce136]|uniref:formylglycine-generating enzyme family protein n=1 Tax=Sorangium sp. So ce136 TaxID=3133284 RepID=UPI003F07DDE3